MRNDLYIEHEVKVSSEVCTPLGYAERIYMSARPLIPYWIQPLNIGPLTN